MKNMLKTYLRDEKRNPIGVVVVIKQDNDYRFGYSLCAPCDKFDKQKGVNIAVHRANAANLQSDEALAPLVSDRRQKVLDAYAKLDKVAQKYFK